MGIFSTKKKFVSLTKVSVIYISNDITITLQKIKDIQTEYTKIENWKKNRVPDNVRIKQIALNYTDPCKEYLVDGLVSAWNPKGTQTLYIYDGIHRYLASQKFSNNLMLLKIITTDNEDLIVQDFKKINKSVSIPYLFLDDYNELKITVCNSVMDMFIKEWPDNQSASRKPWVCNYNKDAFFENVLSELNVDFTLPNIDKLIFDAIRFTNQYTKQYTLDHQIKTYKKSETTGFYLAYIGWNTLKYKIEQCIKNL